MYIYVIVLCAGLGPDNRKYRDTIRKGWAHPDLQRKHKIRVEFSVGLPHPLIEPHLNNTGTAAEFNRIAEEHKLHGDILQANFLDTFNNLIRKWWAVMWYTAKHCQHVPLVAVADEDEIIFLDRLEKLLDTEHMKNKLVGLNKACSMIFVPNSNPSIRDPGSKYYVSNEQWPWPMLPGYCSGNFMMTTWEGAKALASAVGPVGLDYVMGFKIWDVPTGLVAKKANVSIWQIPGRGLIPYAPIPDICDTSNIGVHGMRPMVHGDINLLDDVFEMKQACCVDGEPVNQPRCITSHNYPPGVPLPRKNGGLPGNFLHFPAGELQLFTFDELAKMTFNQLVIEIEKKKSAGATVDPNGPIWQIRDHNIVVYATRADLEKTLVSPPLPGVWTTPTYPSNIVVQQTQPMQVQSSTVSTSDTTIASSTSATTIASGTLTTK